MIMLIYRTTQAECASIPLFSYSAIMTLLTIKKLSASLSHRCIFVAQYGVEKWTVPIFSNEGVSEFASSQSPTHPRREVMGTVPLTKRLSASTNT